MRFKVHERHLEHLDEEIETVGTYLGAFERNSNQNKGPAAENSLKGLKRALHQVSVMTNVMRLTTAADGEIYTKLCAKRNELIQQFSEEYADLTQPQAIQLRDQCLGMLNFNEADLAYDFHVSKPNPEPPNPKFLEYTGHVLGQAQANGGILPQSQQPRRGAGRR